MCEINFAHILSLWETGGRGWGGGGVAAILKLSQKWKKCTNVFRYFLWRFICAFFVKLRQGRGFGEGGVAILKLFHRDRILANFIMHTSLRDHQEMTSSKKAHFCPPPCHLYVTFADPPPTSRHLLDPKKIRIFFDFKFIPKKWVFFYITKKCPQKKYRRPASGIFPPKMMSLFRPPPCHL